LAPYPGAEPLPMAARVLGLGGKTLARCPAVYRLPEDQFGLLFLLPF